MDHVTCCLEIEFSDNEHRFDESWTFNIDIYLFEYLDPYKIKVTFRYEDEVNIVEDGVLTHNLSSWSDAYLHAEENLQTLLDIITFEKSGVGLRIVPNSRELSHTSGKSYRQREEHIIQFHELQSITDRYERTNEDYDEKLLDALGLNRLASNEENDGEKITQLWSSVERLYASEPPKVIDSKAKRKELSSLIDSSKLLDDQDKIRLKHSIDNTTKASKTSIIAEKFSLIDGSGTSMNIKDIKEKLDYWVFPRNKQSHGIIMMRNRDVRHIANEMGHIMETALSTEIKPSKHIHIIYKESEVHSYFGESRRDTIKHYPDDYRSMPLHKFAAFNDVPKLIRYSLIDETSKVYYVDYRNAYCVTLNDASALNVDEQDEQLKLILKDRMAALN